jgi:hypothetical protein
MKKKKNLERRNPLATFLVIGKLCTIPITSGFYFVFNPVIGIVHGFSIFQNLAGGFFPKFFSIQILGKNHF